MHDCWQVWMYACMHVKWESIFVEMYECTIVLVCMQNDHNNVCVFMHACRLLCIYQAEKLLPILSSHSSFPLSHIFNYRPTALHIYT